MKELPNVIFCDCEMKTVANREDCECIMKREGPTGRTCGDIQKMSEIYFGWRNMVALKQMGEHLKIGTVITININRGQYQEFYFTGFDGLWLCGKPTGDTRKFDGTPEDWRDEDLQINDVAAFDVTHIDRIPVIELQYWKSNENSEFPF